jgi:hypothetical protein
VEQDHPPRRQLHGYVSTEARDGWYDFAEKQGTNVTALLEATGLLLGESAKRDLRQLPAWLRDLVAHARQIASGRSSRQRRDG